MKLAISAFQHLHQRVTIVNLPEFDWPLGHLRGGPADTWNAWRLMSRLDDDIGSFQAVLAGEHVLKDTLFVITADHGMTTLTHRVPYRTIKNAISLSGTTLEDYQYHSGAFLWLHAPSRTMKAAAALAALHNPWIQAVYYRMRGQGRYLRIGRRPLSPAVDAANRYLLGTLTAPGAPHIVVFLKENAAIAGRKEVGWKGDHGGGSWNAEHIPLIISGPGIRRGFRSTYPATIFDITPTILTVLGIDAVRMDGVPLADALTNPDEVDVARQAERGSELEPFVDALIAQSMADTGGMQRVTPRS